MSGEDTEIANYLRTLIDHVGQCDCDDCPTCGKLQAILEIVKNRLFGSLVYPERMISAAVSRTN
jgi:hypothetical protein